MKKIFATAAIICSIALTTNAQTIRKTARNEHIRTAQGVKSGELTKNEAANLVHKQRETRKDIKDARADGIVTHDERKEIKTEQAKTSAAIYRKKHNGRVRN